MAIRDRLAMSRFLPLYPREPTYEQPPKRHLERIAPRHLVLSILATHDARINEQVYPFRLRLKHNQRRTAALPVAVAALACWRRSSAPQGLPRFFTPHFVPAIMTVTMDQCAVTQP